MNERIGVAVIGCGLFGSVHAEAYSAHPFAELLWVCDIDEKRAKEAGEKYGSRWTTSLEEVAEDKGVKAVSVATPDFAHYDVVMHLLRKGKHVLVEKPMATSTREAEDMAREARERGLFLMVDFHNRFNPPFNEAKEAIERGEIGEPIMGYARLSNPLSVPLQMLSWSGKSGPHWFLMPHIADLMLWFFGKSPKRVFAKARKGILASQGVDTFDCVQAILMFDGAFATLESSWILPNSYPSIVDFQFQVVGSKGKIEINGGRQGIEIAGERFAFPLVLDKRELGGDKWGFALQSIWHFVNCVKENRPPAILPEEGVMVTRVIEAIQKSAEEERILDV